MKTRSLADLPVRFERCDSCDRPIVHPDGPARSSGGYDGTFHRGGCPDPKAPYPDDRGRPYWYVDQWDLDYSVCDVCRRYYPSEDVEYCAAHESAPFREVELPVCVCCRHDLERGVVPEAGSKFVER